MSVKRNFIYNSILTVSGYVFTLLTYPYISRVLGLSNVGIVNFVDGIINYFILFAMMGVNTLGIREIAVAKTDRTKLSNAFSGILLLNGITVMVAVVVLLVSMYTVPQLIPHRNLLYIGVCKLITTLFLIEWFYTGLEHFSYITKRSVAIKLIYVICVFLLIRKPSDYYLYYLLCVLTIVLNSMINLVYSRKFINFTIRGLQIKKYLKTFFSVGFYVILSSMYTSLTVVWLGMAAGTDQVGYYTTATKLHAIIIALLTAFQNTLFPRVTSLLAEGKTAEYREKINISVDSLLTFSIPTMVLFIILGPNILHILVGDGYEGAYLPYRIIAPLLFIIGYEQIICIQILLAMKQEKKLLLNSCFGAFVGILLNLLIVGHLGAIGSSLVWLLSELVVMTGAQYCVTRIACYSFPWKLILKYIITYIPAIILLMVFYEYCNYSEYVVVMIAGIFIAAYTVVVQIKVLKNPICLQFINKVATYAQQKHNI